MATGDRWEGCPYFPLIILQSNYRSPNSQGGLNFREFIVYLNVSGFFFARDIDNQGRVAYCKSLKYIARTIT